MATERQAPDAILASSNLSGAVTSIDDDPDSPDGLWLTTTSGGAGDVRTSFPTPTGSPTVGAGLQEFRAQVRKNASGGNNIDVTVELYENGSSLGVSASTTGISSTTGTVLSLTWNASSLGTADGSLVECRVYQTSGHSGSPSNRRYLEVGAVEWNVDYTTGVSGTLAATESGADTASMAGQVKVQGTLAATEGATDTAAAAGTVLVSGTMAPTEAADTAALAGTVDVQGALAATEATDTAAIAGGVTVQGALAATEGADSADFAGTTGAGVSGDLAVTDTPDTASFAGGVTVQGPLAATDAPDTVTAAGGVAWYGTMAATEAADVAAMAGTVLVSGALSATEAADVAGILGAVSVPWEEGLAFEVWRLVLLRGRSRNLKPPAFRTATPAIDTSAYASGDCLGDLMEFDVNEWRPDGGGLIQWCTIADLAKQQVETDVVLFSANPTATTFTDNAALDIHDNDLPYVLGAMKVDLWTPFNDNAIGQPTRLYSIPFHLEPRPLQSRLYGILVTRGAPTYVSAADLTVTLGLVSLG